MGASRQNLAQPWLIGLVRRWLHPFAEARPPLSLVAHAHLLLCAAPLGRWADFPVVVNGLRRLAKFAPLCSCLSLCPEQIVPMLLDRDVHCEIAVIGRVDIQWHAAVAGIAVRGGAWLISK